MSSVWPTTLWFVLWSGRSAQLFLPREEFPATWHLKNFFVKVDFVILSLYHRAVRTDSTAMPRGGAVADGASKADREDRNEEIG